MLYHVTNQKNAASIIGDGFLGGWGGVGFGVYLYDNLSDAETYVEKGGWDGCARPDDLCIIRVESDDFVYVTPDPGWDNPEYYASVVFHEMEDKGAFWAPTRLLVPGCSPSP